MKNLSIVGLFFVVLFFLSGCGGTRYVLADSSTTSYGVGSPATQPSQEELVSRQIAEEMTRVKKIIDLDDPKLNPRVRAAYVKAHAELDELFVQAQICEAENLVALRHNVLKSKDCTPNGFSPSPNHSEYGAAFNRRAQGGGGSGGGGGNVIINNNVGGDGYDDGCYVVHHRFVGTRMVCDGYVDLSGPTIHRRRHYRHYPRCSWMTGWFGTVWKCRG